jgi:gluconate 2-dehydrogenase gamma chain
MQIDRRTALMLLSAGIAPSKAVRAQQHVHQLRKDPGSYRLQFFTSDENALLERISELIIPQDSRSGGASDARVSYYIDLIVAHSPKSTQLKWKERLQAFRRLAKKEYGGEFESISRRQQAAMLDGLAANEMKPIDASDKFFIDVKQLTIAGYYTSEIGLRRELGYKGNQVLSSFPGCIVPGKTV